ncbi:MAG TPA: DUF4389 domain-containing protein [Thermoleophilia bacterium]|nr:DUF4389 domain-containing protein [Thermoleophilia bacterium]
MDVRDYPVDVRADYPQSSSRLWAVLTIFWIKWLALIPHWFCLIFLGIAQFVVALVAQFIVAFTGEYPEGMHAFVTGVLRWQTRVTAFFFSMNDRYPPFTLEPVPDYPVDVVVRRPEQPNRTYAIFTIIVEILAIAGGIWLAVWFVGHTDTFQSLSSTSSNGSNFNFRFNFPTSFGGSGLVLRQLAAIPHYIVLLFIGIAAVVIWIVVQWVILFVARFPYGMWELVTGFVRWTTRVNAYALGLVDHYPPFSLSPSVGGREEGLTPVAPPPAAGMWPQVPPAQPPAPPAPPPAPQPAAPPSQAPVPEVPATQEPPAQAAPQPAPPEAAPPSVPEPPQPPTPPGGGV